jgi:hypothetical protein
LWAQQLRDTLGRLTTTALTAQVVASGTVVPLEESSFDALDVGTGLVQAPQA